MPNKRRSPHPAASVCHRRGQQRPPLIPVAKDRNLMSFARPLPRSRRRLSPRRPLRRRLFLCRHRLRRSPLNRNRSDRPHGQAKHAPPPRRAPSRKLPATAPRHRSRHQPSRWSMRQAPTPHRPRRQRPHQRLVRLQNRRCLGAGSLSACSPWRPSSSAFSRVAVVLPTKEKWSKRTLCPRLSRLLRRHLPLSRRRPLLQRRPMPTAPGSTCNSWSRRRAIR